MPIKPHHHHHLTTWTRKFAMANVAAGCVFAITCAYLLRYDFLRRGRDKLVRVAEGSITSQLVKEPRVGAYFLICLACLTWLVAFFALGLVQEIQHDVKRKKKKIITTPIATLIQQCPPPDNRKPVAILGGTGLVGRALALRLESHPTLKLGMMVGSPDSQGKPIASVWLRKEAILHQHYGDWWIPMPLPPSLQSSTVSSFQELMDDISNNNYDQIVISVVAPALGWMEDQLVQAGVKVFSISPHKRVGYDNVPLVVPEVNVNKMFDSPLTHNGGKLFKSPNCVSVGLCLVLDAVRTSYGDLLEVSVTTFQSLTGRGDALYPREFVVGNILPLGGTEEDTNNKIRDEVCRVLGEPNLPISVTAQRVFTQRGHYVDVRIKTSKPVLSTDEFANKLATYAPFRTTMFENLPDAPMQPILVTHQIKEPRPIQSVALLNSCMGQGKDGMAVHVGHINTDDRVFDVCFSFVVDNVARGAFGAALLMAECFHAGATSMKKT